MGIVGTESLVHRASHKRRLSCIPVLNQIKKAVHAVYRFRLFLKPKTSSLNNFSFEKKNHEYTCIFFFKLL